MAKRVIRQFAVLLLLAMLLSLFAVEVCASDVKPEDYAGKKIGVLTGSVFDIVAKENIDPVEICSYNSNSDVAVALDKGKIDAFIIDQPVWRILNQTYPDQQVVYVFSNEDYGFIFRKNENGTKICNQMNEFLKKCKKDGTLEEIDKIWFGTDEAAQTIDMSVLSGENGTLILSTSTDLGAPFAYIKNNQIVGYDIDVAVRFCREYGYGLKINNSTFAGMIADVSEGKSDFGAACITITEERKESMLFSEADYSGGCVLVAKTAAAPVAGAEYNNFAGAKIGVQTGAASDGIVAEYFPDCTIEYFVSNADLATALESGKIAGYVVDEPFARYMCSDYPNHHVLVNIKEEDYALVLPKVNPGSQKLCDEINEFLKKSQENGTLKEIDAAWIENDTSKQHIDFSSLTGENGTLKMATCSSVGAPFTYIHNNEHAGYDIDFAVRFCKEYGYALEIIDLDVTGLFSSLASGKCDFAACCIAVTEERKETMIFTDTYYDGGYALVVKDGAASAETGGFFASVAESFRKTFVREDRYKLFLSGILTTATIVVLSLIFGSLLGFLMYFGYYRLGKGFRYPADWLATITENTPVIVILMILYYVIFGSTEISGIWVSVMGFSLIFACSVMGLLKVGVNAVDPGQREAALALGYSESHTLFRIILPQAVRHFLPGYKSAIVQLIKGTAIVGYIAVQDLTRVSDIIRSRTYEAFFPLIASAVLYFAIAILVTAVINRIELHADPHSRKEGKILKGVKIK